jgi:hypothetical protein
VADDSVTKTPTLLSQEEREISSSVVVRVVSVLLEAMRLSIEF